MLALLGANYFQVDIKDIEILVAIMTFIVAGFFGILVLAANPKSWTHRLFATLVLVFNVYTVVNYISLHPLDPDSQLYWIRLVMFLSSFMGPLLLLFISTFPEDRITMKWGYLSAVVGLALATAVSSLSPLVFKSLQYINGQPLPVAGKGMPLFLIDFAGLIITSFILLIYKYKKSEGQDKKRRLYLMNGIIISFSLIAAVTVISVVILKTSNFVFLGPLLFVILIIATGLAIVRYQLFDIKIIATNLLVVTLWIVLFSKLFVGEKSFVEMTVDVIILVLIIVFGILIVKSVKKEVEQREKLEVLTKQLESANVKLRELDKVKSEFLSFASHQVKTPMAVIKGYATLIFDGTYGEVSDKVKETAVKIKESANRMISLVNELLDLRKIEEKKMEFNFEDIDVSKLLRDVVYELKNLIQDKKIDLSVEIDEWGLSCKADLVKLRQVFQNIIENAIKYTDQGNIRVKLWKEDKFVQVTVSDSGHGISKEILPQLFEQFIRDAKELKKIEGTGLGLYIAKQIVEGHHGQIWAESPGIGRGSIFHVKIPIIQESVGISD